MEDLIRNLDRIRDKLDYFKIDGTIIVDRDMNKDKLKLTTIFNDNANLFKEMDMDLSDKFQATINVDIVPQSVKVTRPRFTLKQYKNGAETDRSIAFSRCRIHYDGIHFYGVLYHPYASNECTSTVEIIAPYIPGIKPGDQVQVDLVSNEVELIEE